MLPSTYLPVQTSPSPSPYLILLCIQLFLPTTCVCLVVVHILHFGTLLGPILHCGQLYACLLTLPPCSRFLLHPTVCSAFLLVPACYFTFVWFLLLNAFTDSALCAPHTFPSLITLPFVTFCYPLPLPHSSPPPRVLLPSLYMLTHSLLRFQPYWRLAAIVPFVLLPQQPHDNTCHSLTY